MTQDEHYMMLTKQAVAREGTLTTDSAARKDTPIFSGVLRYFPDALADVARLSKIGNDKHNPGQPLHWSRDKSTDHGDCVVRHQIDVGTIDLDTCLHDTKVAWRALAQLQVAIEALRAAGIEYPPAPAKAAPVANTTVVRPYPHVGFDVCSDPAPATKSGIGISWGHIPFKGAVR